MESNGVNNFGTLTANNQATRTQTNNQLSPPPKGYTRIWIEVKSNVPKGRDGKVVLPDADIERALFNRFELRSETEADLLKLKTLLGTTDNPFDNVRTSVGGRTNHRADGVYRIPLDVEDSLYAKLSGKAVQIKKEIEQSKPAAGSNPNESIAGRNGIDRSKVEQARLAQRIRDAQVDSTSFGIPSKLTDMTHVIIALPAGVAPNADSALSAYIERQFGGGNLYGPDKLAILSAAKSNGVKAENFKIDPNNHRVVEFDISLENRLILRKAYLDVQEKVNSDIAISDKARDEMAVNQFLLGVMQGAYDDVAGNIHTLTHPLETLQGIRDAIGILSQLSAADIKNIAAELGNKAANATPGEAAHAAGYVVGTIAVELLLAKGAGVVIGAFGKTKAGAEFLARIAKLTEKVGEVANLGKAKIAEIFSDEAAALAKERLLKTFPVNGQPLAVLPGAPLPVSVIKDFGTLVGNKIGNGVTSFRQIVSELSNEVGAAVKPHLDELANAYRQAMKQAGLKADENEIISIFNEWEVERAKNINDSIKVSSTSEITSAGWYERQALRRKIGQAEYPSYDKHIKATSIEDAIKRSSTGKKEAQFLPEFCGKLKGLYGEAIENAISNGLVKKEGGKWIFIHKFEKQIGFNEGKESKWIKIELTDNSTPSIHGHPTNLQEVRRLFPDVKGEK